ncbi:MAG TPA: hypothetical protein VIK61_14735 [Acidimicrobiia bacterium]
MNDIDPARRANFDPGGTIDVASRWLTAILEERDLAKAWPLTAPDFRLGRAQAWILDTSGRPDDELARGLSAPDQPAHPQWANFADWAVTRWHLAWGMLVRDGWGYLDNVEIAGVDLEQVLVVQGDEARAVAAGEELLVWRFTLHRTDTWRVAGTGTTIVVPGWPPRDAELPS